MKFTFEKTEPGAKPEVENDLVVEEPKTWEETTRFFSCFDLELTCVVFNLCSAYLKLPLASLTKETS